MNCDLLSFPDAESLARAAAERWLKKLAAAAGRGQCSSVALSGGRIAGRFFAAAAAAARTLGLAVAQVEFFWADERGVPPEHPESNFALAQRALLRPLGVAPERIHRLLGELAPDLAAQAGEAEVRQFLPANPHGQPVFDLVLLGMGEDGHVASLFPDAPAELAASRAVYLPVIGPKPPPQRITLGYSPLAAAREVWVLVSGPGKEAALHESLQPQGRTPLARVLRSRPATVIMTDLPKLSGN
jgi:6-phosphogluconolactonase